MVIAVLGWGSLIWNPGDLPLASSWFENGPHLPVEFARQSNDGRLTLVIHGDHDVQSLWARLSCDTLDEARQALGWREGCVNQSNTDLLSRHIGWWNQDAQSKDHKYPDGHDLNLTDWAMQNDIVGIVWTALPSRRGSEKRNNGTYRSLDESISYLHNLEGRTRDVAFEYIQKTPIQIRTPYRQAFEAEFPELRI